MPDYTSLVQAMQMASVRAVDAGGPVLVEFGTVTVARGSTASPEIPVEIYTDQKITLREEDNVLIMTRAVVDHYVDLEVRHVTELRGGGSGDAAFQSHDHDYLGTKKVLVYDGLVLGERVLLLRLQGGQRWVVWDRLTDHSVRGEWLA